jgi:hypothetical protein
MEPEESQKAGRRPESLKGKAREPEVQGQQHLAKERVRTEKFQQLEQKNSNKMLGVSRC